MVNGAGAAAAADEAISHGGQQWSAAVVSSLALLTLKKSSEMEMNTMVSKESESEAARIPDLELCSLSLPALPH